MRPAPTPPARLDARLGFAHALRRADPLAWGGLLAALVLVAFPLYWAMASLVPLFGGSEGHAADFGYYYRAGLRLRADPLGLYDEDSFLYPPPAGAPFALVSFLPIAWGYVLFAVGTVAALVASLRIVERLTDARLGGWARGAWWAVGLASAAALQNVKFGQVNTVVLLAALLFVRAVSDPEARPRALALGGAVLALGAWLKVYPLALGVFALRRRTWPALAGLVAGLAVVPLALLPLVPGGLYRTFATERLAGLAASTTPSTLNASLPAIVERLSLPPEALLRYTTAPFGTAASVASLVVLVGGIALAAWVWRRGWPAWRAAFAVLAVVPVASTLGWEYTFALALPAFLGLVAQARRGPLGVRLVAIAAVVAWTLQKPPEGVMRWAVVHAPVVSEVFAARIVLALAALAAAVWWNVAPRARLTFRRRGRGEAVPVRRVTT